jgi:hypothetical protein
MAKQNVSIPGNAPAVEPDGSGYLSKPWNDALSDIADAVNLAAPLDAPEFTGDVSVAGNFSVPNGVTTLRETSIDGAVGFGGASPQARQTVTGTRGGNTALGSLLIALNNLGLITNSTTP